MTQDERAEQFVDDLMSIPNITTIVRERATELRNSGTPDADVVWFAICALALQAGNIARLLAEVDVATGLEGDALKRLHATCEIGYARGLVEAREGSRTLLQ
jgi:hypothetical protein